MITYNNIIGRFEEFVNAHLMLRTFTHGSPSGVDLEKFEVYPALHVVYTGSTYDNTSKEYSFEVYILDLPPDKAKKVENQTQLVSNAEQVAEDILADMMNGGKVFDFGHLYTVSNASTTPLEETTSNSLAGILLSISIEVGFTLDSCNAPLIGVTPSGSGFPAASPSGLLEVRTQDGNPTATKVTTIIVSNGTLVDNGLGVVTIDTDIPTNVYLPLTGGTLTGDLNVDADLTVTGEITADSNFISSDSILVAATTGAGSILLRPNGKSQNLGQVILDSAGKVTTTGEAQVGGELSMSTNKITNLLAGTTNLDAVNYQQLTDAVTGVLVYKGTWDADTNNPTLASGVGDVGSYYIVSVSGSTDLDGITDWVVGDWAVFSSTEWQKIDNTSILGGVGTGGKISKWTGSGVSRTLGDSVIYEDGGNIGIGNSAPSKTLSVNGTFQSTGEAFLSHFDVITGNSRFRDNKRLWFNTDRSFGIYGDASKLHIGYDGGSFVDAITIVTSGNVGIGITSPTEKLHVEGDALVNGTLDTTGNIEITGNSIGYIINEADSGNQRWQMFGLSGQFVVRDITGGSYPFRVEPLAPTNSLYIKANGFIGIGTASPNFLLDVEGDNPQIRLNNTTSDGSTTIKLRSPGTAGSGQIQFGDSADSNSGQILYSHFSDSMRFNTNNSEALRIDSSGNVGIGTNNPAAQLDVRTPDGNASSLRIGRTDNANYWDVNHAGNDLRIYNTAASGSNILLGVDAAGNAEANNVGIGTASPGVKLDVDGQIRTDDSFLLQSGATAIGSIRNQSGALDIRGDSTRDVSLGSVSNPQSLFVEGTNGNVGIGTTAPAYKLSVNGDIQTNVVRGYLYPTQNVLSLEDDNLPNQNGVSLQSVGSMAHYIDVNNNSSNDSFDWLADDNSAGSATNLMRLTDEGNLGIGTTAPVSKLDVSGGDVEVKDIASGIIMKSPDGTRYRVTVANGGTLSVAAV